MALPDSGTTAIQKVSRFMRSDAVIARFADTLGDRNAKAFVSSVMLAVASDDTGKLAQCTPESIYVSALRAATLRLSVDPSTGQAYLVPYGKKATLIVGYKGLQDMAVRTGKYRYINVLKIFEGETVEPDQISGLITMKSLGGKKTSDKVIGYVAAFEMNPERGQMLGYAHTLYMTVEEIHAHAKKHNPAGYARKDARAPWLVNTEEMERKTPLRILLRKYGYLDPADVATLEEMETESPTEPAIDGEIVEPALDEPKPEETKPAQTEAQLLTELGNGDAPVSDAMWDKWLRLCVEADALSLFYPPDHKDSYSNATLAKVYTTLESQVKEKRNHA